MFRIVTKPSFDNFICSVVVVNVVWLSMAYYGMVRLYVCLCSVACVDMPQSQSTSYFNAITALDDACTMIYVVEMALVCCVWACVFQLFDVCVSSQLLFALGFNQFTSSAWNILGLHCLSCVAGI